MADQAPEKTASPWLTVVKIAVSAVLLGLLVLWADPEKILKAFRDFRWSWAPVIWGSIFISVALSAWKWGLLIRGKEGCIGWMDLFGTYTAGLFFNNFLPSSIGGDGARILIAGRFGFSKATAAASVVVERTLATASLGLLGLAAGLLSTHGHTLAMELLGAVFLVGLFLTWLLLSGRLPKKIREGNGKVAAALKSFSASSGALRERPRALAGSFLLSAGFQASVALVVWGIFPALGLTPPPLVDLIFIVSAASVLAMVPLGLNGYGLREGAFILLLAPYGNEASQALIISVIFALSVSVFSLPGAAFWALRKPKAAACPLPQGAAS